MNHDEDQRVERAAEIPPETSPEAPEADVAEQRADLLPEEPDSLEAPGALETPEESDPQDAADQRRAAPADEDDYR